MRKSLFVLSGLCLVLASCAGTRPAPVEDRSPAPGSSSVPASVARVPAAARPGYHQVAKGDTLYSIALEYGQDWRDLIIWNRLENPNLIRVGQEVRVTPPEGAVETQPIAAASGVESRPIQPIAATPPATAAAEPVIPSANTALVKREPRGGVEPYSEQALAQMKSGAAVPAVAPSAAVATAEAAPVAAAVTAPDSVRAEAGVEWSWPSSGRIVGRFGEGTNKGVDLAGRTGDPVLAAAGGRVVYAGEAMRGYGKLVIVKHDGTFLSVMRTTARYSCRNAIR